MNYLPIFEELFESDSLCFLTAGFIITIVIGFRIKQASKILMAAGLSILIYIICEIIANNVVNVLFNILLIFVGSFSLGSCLGFILSIPIERIWQFTLQFTKRNKD